MLKMIKSFPSLYCALFVALLFTIIPSVSQAETSSSPQVQLLTINGPIGPATATYIERGISKANAEQATLIMIQIDTPGGLDLAMRDIIKSILNSNVPIASYVAPKGARAASAGTYILYASPIAAMAPGTNMGAATPVSLGGVPGTSPDKANPSDAKNKPANTSSDMSKKIKKDAAAYIHSLAELHGRNTAWAQKAVFEADSIPASKALAMNVIDLIAEDIPDLLQQVDGRSVKVQGQNVVLNTKNSTVTTVAPDWRIKFLNVITNPSVAYILLLIGMYGLFFEFAHPGFVVPGVVGAICMLIALYALQLLPISYVGLGLIFLGVIFMVSEAFIPSFGALGIGGLIAFALGSVMLIDTQIPGYGIPWTLILAVLIANALFFFVLIAMAIKARKRPIVSGREAIIGRSAIANENFEKTGWVKLDGENWRSESDAPIKQGQKVEIYRQDSLTLFVKPVTSEE